MDAQAFSLAEGTGISLIEARNIIQALKTQRYNDQDIDKYIFTQIQISVLKSLHIPENQIESIMKYFDIKTTSLGCLRLRAKSIELDLNCLVGVPIYELDFTMCPIKFTDLTPLELCNISVIRNLSVDEATDLSPINGVKELSVWFKPLLTKIGFVHTQLPSLDGLEGVEKLKVSGLITDLSPISGVRELDIEGCAGITDLSPISGVEVLNIARTNIKDLEPLRGVKVLNIDYCFDITDLTPIRGVKELSMRHCVQIQDLTPIRGVKILNIDGCVRIKDITPVCNDLILIDISNCYKLTGYSCLVEREVRILTDYGSYPRSNKTISLFRDRLDEEVKDIMWR